MHFDARGNIHYRHSLALTNATTYNYTNASREELEKDGP